MNYDYRLMISVIIIENGYEMSELTESLPVVDVDGRIFLPVLTFDNYNNDIIIGVTFTESKLWMASTSRVYYNNIIVYYVYNER